MTTDPAPTVDVPTPPAGPGRKRSSRRLRVLLALGAAALGLHVFVHLDRSAAEWLGPLGEGVHDLFNQVPGKAAPLSATARRLKRDVEEMGGYASVSVSKRGLFGVIGRTEWINVNFHNPDFDDAALARLAEAHGDRIGGLYLQDTGVTDAGLKGLGKFTMLRHLMLRNARERARPGSKPKISDAGLAHLRGLVHLWSLDLSDLPITDAGLAAIDDLPELLSLHLGRTGVEGRGLSRLKSLPRLNILDLDGSRMTEDGLRALSGATGLQFLSLDRVPLTPGALPLLKAIPRVDRLELTGCGLLDQEADALEKGRPGLKVIRH